MLFNSIHFLLFFPIVIFIYFSLPHRWRWLLLLIASYYFYMSWKAEYALLILASTVVDYFAGLKMGKIKKKEARRPYLIISLIANLGLLFAFKYLNFFSESLRTLLQSISIEFTTPYLNVLLPVGISFYTFQTLSYTIDLYYGKIKPERHFGIFALYVAYFPRLVAGPIERAKNLLPQFRKEQQFKYKRVTDGLKLMLWGFFKKLVIADRVAAIVNLVYNNPTDHTGFPLIVATVLFAVQIYCDFSGYSDIAIGAAQVMGIRLMDNFKRPYYSRSVREFWTRWHISLSSWFRDYLYIPLGGSRVAVPRWYFNLMIVFLISGLWHGANWTFVIWGALHGLYLIFSIVSKPLRERLIHLFGLVSRPRLHAVWKGLFTFAIVNFAWIFFRANSLSDAWYIVTHLFTDFSLNLSFLGVHKYDFVIGLVFIAFMELVHVLQEHNGMRSFISDKPLALRWGIYLFIVWAILLFGSFGNNYFIYFQF